LIEESIYRRLDLDFYEPRVEALTPAERDLLVDTAVCSYPPLYVAELNSASYKSPENVNVLLGRLVRANVMFRPRKGEYRYTAPGFRDFLLRRAKSTPPAGPSGDPRLFPMKISQRMSTTEILRTLVADLGSANVGFALGFQGEIPADLLDGGVSRLDAHEVDRLKAAHRAFRLISRSLGADEARDWFLSSAADLGMDTPAQAVREDRLMEVLEAAADYMAE
jgi:hypothetical protein